MAITKSDTSTSGVGYSTRAEWSHTAAGDYLVIGVVTASQRTISDVTYNGVSLGAALFDNSEATGSCHVAAYGMANPPAGAHTVVVTINGTDIVFGVAVGFSGVASVRTPVTADALTVTVTNSAAGDYLLGVCGVYGTNITATETTEGEDDEITGGARSGNVSTKLATGTNETFTWTGGTYGACGAFALVPAAGVAPSWTPRVTLVL